MRGSGWRGWLDGLEAYRHANTVAGYRMRVRAYVGPHPVAEFNFSRRDTKAAIATRDAPARPRSR